MTIRVSVTHHDDEAEHAMLVQVFRVEADGTVCETPVRSQALSPGVTATVHLQTGDALVVRERE